MHDKLCGKCKSCGSHNTRTFSVVWAATDPPSATHIWKYCLSCKAKFKIKVGASNKVIDNGGK